MRAAARPKGLIHVLKPAALALFPILSAYDGILAIELGFLVLLAVALLDVIHNRGQFYVNRDVLIVFALMAALNIVTGFIHMASVDITRTMYNTLYMLVVGVTCSYYAAGSAVDRDRLFKYLCVAGVISCAFALVQHVLYLRGIVVSGMIPGLKIGGLASSQGGVSIGYGRPTSFFPEPSHFAIFILPLYAMVLLRRRLWTAAVFLAGLAVSTSTLGVVGAVVVTAVFLIREPRIPHIIKWAAAVAGAVLLVQFFPDIKGLEIFQKVRFLNLKSSIRVFGTLHYFKYFGMGEVLFGVGYPRLADYLVGLTTEPVYNYANAFFYSFFSFGLVGGSIWSYYIFTLHRLARKKLVYIAFLLVYMTDQILFNRNLAYLLIILYVFADRPPESGPGAGPALPD